MSRSDSRTSSTHWSTLLSAALHNEIAPGGTRVAVLRDSGIAAGIGQFAAVQTVAPMNIELSVVGLQEAAEIEQSLAGFAHGS